jgi:hypothetical protein
MMTYYDDSCIYMIKLNYFIPLLFNYLEMIIISDDTLDVFIP